MECTGAPGVVILVPATYDMWMQFFYEQGIINGKSTTQADYAEGDSLNREEAAVIVLRVINYVNRNNPLIKKSAPDYMDGADISEWAYDSIAMLQGTGIMDCCEDNRFFPQKECSIEEAAGILYRLSCFGKNIGMDTLKARLASDDGINIDTFRGYRATVSEAAEEGSTPLYRYHVDDRFMLELDGCTNAVKLVCKLDGKEKAVTSDTIDEVLAQNTDEHYFTETYHMTYGVTAVHDMMPHGGPGPASASYIVFDVYTDETGALAESVDFAFSVNGKSENIVATQRPEKTGISFRISGWSGREQAYTLVLTMTDKKTGKVETVKFDSVRISYPW